MIWWRRVREKLPEKAGIHIKGDPMAWPKWIPLIWRYKNAWVLLGVGQLDPPLPDDPRNDPTKAGYFFCFRSGSTEMEFKHSLIETQVLARKGKRDVDFFAVSIEGTLQYKLVKLKEFKSKKEFLKTSRAKIRTAIV